MFLKALRGTTLSDDSNTGGYLDETFLGGERGISLSIQVLLLTGKFKNCVSKIS